MIDTLRSVHYRPLRGVIDGGSQEPTACVRLFVWNGRVKNSRRRPVRRPARGRCTGRGDAEEREMVVVVRRRQAEVEVVRFCDTVEDTAAAVRLSARSPGNTPPPDKLQDVAVAV